MRRDCVNPERLSGSYLLGKASRCQLSVPSVEAFGKVLAREAVRRYNGVRYITTAINKEIESMRRRLPLPALRSLLIPTIMLVSVSGCFQRAGVNTNCEWPYHTQESLDLRKAADQRRLRDEVQLAEELAVRHMDERRLSDGEDSGRRKL